MIVRLVGLVQVKAAEQIFQRGVGTKVASLPMEFYYMAFGVWLGLGTTNTSVHSILYDQREILSHSTKKITQFGSSLDVQQRKVEQQQVQWQRQQE